jgi:hypothetical protein
MKTKILEKMVMHVTRKIRREPSSKEMKEMEEIADILARDMHRIARLEANEYINKIRQKETIWQRSQEKIQEDSSKKQRKKAS